MILPDLEPTALALIAALPEDRREHEACEYAALLVPVSDEARFRATVAEILRRVA